MPRNHVSAAIVVSVATIVLAIISTLSAQSQTMNLRKIADNVYVMQHPAGSSNSMFVVTDEGVVVWDGDIRTADQVFAAIRRTTGKKIKYYLISHPAGDHATGGWHYREDQPVMISSRRQAKSLAEEELEEFTTRHNSNDPVYGPITIPNLSSRT